MDFFEHQELAKRNTRRLVALFICAMLALLIVMYFITVVILSVTRNGSRMASDGQGALEAGLWDLEALVWVSLTTFVVVGLGTAYKSLALRGGGARVAELVGGTLVSPQTTDLDERRLLNVVEEMAIASGLAVPPVYVMRRETGINAFAAGLDPQQSVVAVTSGTLKTLNRDELQGVMGHEFSHILNGDSRLNVRLIGVVHGLLLLHIGGRLLLRHGGSRSSNRRKGSPLALWGLVLLVVGSIGVFFGRLIKAAISRQREFLADAAAVQFTRNPSGIAGALKKIGGFHQGSEVESVRAEEVSHMFFSDAFFGRRGRMLATHPPLAERIKRIDSSFEGEFLHTVGHEVPLASGAAVLGLAGESSSAPREVIRPQDVVASVGVVSARDLQQARAWLEKLPPQLKEAAHDAAGARRIVFAIMLQRDPAHREARYEMVKQALAPSEIDPWFAILKQADALANASRMPLINLCTPALRTLAREQRQQLLITVRKLIEADGVCSMFEFAVLELLHHRLTAHQIGPGSQSIASLLDHAVTLLSALASSGSAGEQEQERAFEAGLARLPKVSGRRPVLVRKELYTLEHVTWALKMLAGLRPAARRTMVDACSYCIYADRVVTEEEHDLMHAVCAALGVPLPAFLGYS